MPTISVIIPVYNAKKYLTECLQSVIAQTYRDFEIILVDDGSTDGSGELCDRYAAEYDFVLALHQKNGGASAARNRGLKEAKGEFVHFIDSDDLLSQNDSYEMLSRNALSPKYDIIFFRRERFIDGQEGIDAVQPAYAIDGEFCGDVLQHVLTEKYQLTLTCPVNKIFRRELLTDNQLFFSAGLDHEEDEWLPRVISCAENVWFDKGIYYKVRNHPDSLSRTTSDEIKARRACSKIKIASTGIEYMKKKALKADTMPLIAEYYWEYFIDACVTVSRLKDPENQNRVLNEIKNNRQFFDSYRYLNNKNRRALGKSFKMLGVKMTVKLIGIRYGK